MLKGDRRRAAVRWRSLPGDPALRRPLLADQVAIVPLDDASGNRRIKGVAPRAEIRRNLEALQAGLFARLAQGAGSGLLQRLQRPTRDLYPGLR